METLGPPPKSAPGILSQVSGDHFVIAGGHFNQWHTNVAATRGGFERLQDAVATAAFHNSAQRVDPPKCHPNTREAVMKRLMDWIVSRDDRDAWIMWLHGAAGAGKSAIAQSIAELCVKQGIPISSFFFSRTDPTRNNIRPLVATLSYQLARNIPASRDFIIQAIDDDPLVFEQSFEHQLELLILNPLREVGRLPWSPDTSHSSPLLILIDGLDECEDRNVQINLICTLSGVSANKENALLFLVASRPESHLAMIFNSRKCDRILARLALDNQYFPDDDICTFLNDKFAEIRDAHPLKHLLNASWPPPPLVDAIVKKSSGQFIYAAVVMKYVSSPSAHPRQRLEVCCGLRIARSDTPFAQLDALYRHIFSQVQDQDCARSVLALARYGSNNIQAINTLFGLARGSVESCLSDLTSVISCDGGRVEFLHGSLIDFLRDPKRSRDYYLDPGIWCSFLAVLWFQVPPPREPGILCITRLLKKADPTPELRRELSNLERTFEERGLWSGPFFQLCELFSMIKALDFNDGGELYGMLFHKIGLHLNFKAEFDTQEAFPMPPTDPARLDMQTSDPPSEVEAVISSTNEEKLQKGKDSKRIQLAQWFRKFSHTKN